MTLMFSTVALGQGGALCGPTSGAGCPSPSPSPTCCDIALVSCQIAVRNCAGTSTANCAAMVCPTTSALPSRRPPMSVNPTKSLAPSRSAYPARSSMMPTPSKRPLPSATATVKQNYPSMSSTPRQVNPSATGTSTQTQTGTPKQADPSATGTSTQTGTPRQADPSATGTPTQTGTSTQTGTPRQADLSATGTPKQADLSATGTPKQADPSATGTPRQADASATGTLTPTQTGTPKKTDASATGTPKQLEPSATPKPGQSARPSRYPRQTFSLLFQNTNNTLIRSPQKLQQFQTVLACVVQTPLENIDITTISDGTTALPFTKPQGTGMPVCNSSRILYRQRRLQATTETTVSFDLLNEPYVSQATFQSNPNVMSFGSSVGASGQMAGSPPAAPTSTENTRAIYGGVIGSLCAVGIAAYGIMYIRSQRKRRLASSKPKTQETINPFAPNNRISYSPAVVKMTRSNSV